VCYITRVTSPVHTGNTGVTSLVHTGNTGVTSLVYTGNTSKIISGQHLLRSYIEETEVRKPQEYTC